tara:strand:- start:200 stop:874 length:675 start_codon:yes stop_codon:yes gene_type:complete
MNKQQQDIIVIMDESGSMDSLGTEPLEAVNTFINTQKNSIENDESTFTLWKFNTEITLAIDNEPLKNIEPFTDFVPQSMTALHDAIGKAIDKKKDAKNVVCVIVTDGLENASQEYTGTIIKKKIQEQETKNNWKFVYLGANQDVFASGRNIGLNLNRCAPFAAHEGHNAGLLSLARHVSDNINDYRTLSSQGVETELVINSENIDVQPPPLKRSVHVEYNTDTN